MKNPLNPALSRLQSPLYHPQSFRTAMVHCGASMVLDQDQAACLLQAKNCLPKSPLATKLLFLMISITLTEIDPLLVALYLVWLE